MVVCCLELLKFLIVDVAAVKVVEYQCCVFVVADVVWLLLW